jgi:hypothetical protein
VSLIALKGAAAANTDGQEHGCWDSQAEPNTDDYSRRYNMASLPCAPTGHTQTLTCAVGLEGGLHDSASLAGREESW